MLKVGLSTGRNERALTEPFLASCQAAGIDGVEVCNAYLDGAMNEDYRYLPTLAAQYNIELFSYHIPFQPLHKLPYEAEILSIVHLQQRQPYPQFPCLQFLKTQTEL